MDDLPGSGSSGAPQVGHLNARMDESFGIFISSVKLNSAKHNLSSVLSI